MTLDAVQPPDSATLAHLHQLGVTHLTLISFGFQPTLNSPEIRMNPDARWFSESDAGIRTLARQIAPYGMKLILKPQLWVGRGAWTADIAMPDEASWQQWENSYRTYILHYARLAQEVQAALLVVATELGNPVRQRPAFWRSLIADIRTYYQGPLTYAANWHADFAHVPFWDTLDYIGVQAYFPLSTETDPSLELLKKGWQPHADSVRVLHERTGKPVLLTEIGYRSVSYAAAEPWRWPSREETGTIPPDYALQARLYQAFFEQVWPEPWLAGMIVWKWHAGGRMGDGRLNLNFTPQGKPAEQVIARWFKQP
jgi:hypothetical protein